MLESHGVPEGHLVDTHHGGEGVLKRMLDDVRKFGFSGYLKSSYSTNAGASEGPIGFNSGEPAITIYVFKKGGASAERLYQGPKAAEFIWEDSVNAECSLSLHSRVPMPDLEKKFAEAKVERVELMPPASLAVAKGVGEVQRLVGKRTQRRRGSLPGRRRDTTSATWCAST